MTRIPRYVSGRIAEDGGGTVKRKVDGIKAWDKTRSKMIFKWTENRTHALSLGLGKRRMVPTGLRASVRHLVCLLWPWWAPLFCLG